MGIELKEQRRGSLPRMAECIFSLAQSGVGYERVLFGEQQRAVLVGTRAATVIFCRSI